MLKSKYYITIKEYYERFDYITLDDESCRGPKRRRQLWVFGLSLTTLTCIFVYLIILRTRHSDDRIFPPTPYLDHSVEELSPTNTFPTDTLYANRTDRPLILYAYHETENARRNAEFFIQHALHDAADFLFILNGETDLNRVIPKADHIKYRARPNKCFDLGAHGEVLLANDGALMKRYNKFILMNASIRGPFVPTWSDTCWTDAYLSKVTEDVKLVGMSYNCRRDYHPHIQSMLLATDRQGLEIMLDKAKMNTCPKKFRDAIKLEVNLTHNVTEAGYKVRAFMTAFASNTDRESLCDNGDPLGNDAYFKINMHPYETMFVKANRGTFPRQLKLLTQWHDGMGYSSQPVCGMHTKV